LILDSGLRGGSAPRELCRLDGDVGEREPLTERTLTALIVPFDDLELVYQSLRN
jgi:hypothetical protein